MFNMYPKYARLFRPEIRPKNPFETQQQCSVKNMLCGYAESAHTSENITLRPSNKRKRHRNNDSSDTKGLLGSWDGYIDEKRIVKPSEVAELEKISAKRNKQGKQTEAELFEEKAITHQRRCGLSRALIFARASRCRRISDRNRHPSILTKGTKSHVEGPYQKHFANPMVFTYCAFVTIL